MLQGFRGLGGLGFRDIKGFCLHVFTGLCIYGALWAFLGPLVEQGLKGFG